MWANLGLVLSRLAWTAIIALILGLSLLTALMAVPDAASIVVLGTLGLGTPLAFSGTALLYVLCALPIPASWGAGLTTQLGGWVLAGILIVAAALGPRYLGQSEAETQARLFRVADHSPTAPVSAATIEIRRPARSWDGTFADQEACGAECRGVLASGAVQWVRTVMIDTYNGAQQDSSTFHRALRGGDCTVPGGASSETAICVVMAADTHEAAELTIAFETPRNASTGTRFAVLEGYRAVVARLSRAGQKKEVLRQTEVGFETPCAPTILGPHFEGINSHGLHILRKLKNFDPITLKGVFEQLGYSLAPSSSAPPPDPTPIDWRQSIDDSMTREMIAVLDLRQAESFNSQQMRPISKWISHARMVKAWTPDLVALLRRFVRDPRVRAPTFFDQIFERNSDVAAALLPDVLDVIAVEGIGPDYTPARQAAYTLTRLDPEILKPYAQRIVALLDHGPDVRAILLPAIGLLGVDPVPYLVPIGADRTEVSQYSRSPRVIGACGAEKRWAPELIGVLRESYRTLPAITRDDVDYLERILMALENLGDRDFVEHQSAPDSRINAARLHLKPQGDPSFKLPSGSLCSTF